VRFNKNEYNKKRNLKTKNTKYKHKEDPKKTAIHLSCRLPRLPALAIGHET
jgi:hypothetical protein